jgi:acetyltransferase-like isoleucine patch superfamily enzyme
MRLLDRLLKPTVARLVASCIEEERVDALYRYRVHSDPARLTIHPTAVVNNAIFNTDAGRITVGEYVFVGHNVCVLAGVHEVDKFGLERQRAIPRSGYEIEIGEGAWLATNVMVAGPVKIGAHAVVGGGSVVRKDIEPYAVVAGNPARRGRRRAQAATADGIQRRVQPTQQRLKSDNRSRLGPTCPAGCQNVTHAAEQ